MELTKRIISAYNNSKIKFNNDSMWIHWIFPKLKDTLDKMNEPDTFKFNLENPSKNYLCFGFDFMCLNSFNNFDDILNYQNAIKNSIIRLCNSLGLLRYHNPEGGEICINNIFDLEDLLIKLDNYFGFKIDFPNIFNTNNEFNWLFYVNYHKDLQDAGIITEEYAIEHYKNYGIFENRKINGEIGLISSRGIIKLRAIHSLYFVSKIKELGASSVLEIGGGMGRNAYYAKKLGIKKYKIIDIPNSCIMSSYYLANTLGEENITLFGENTDKYVSVLNENNYLDECVDLIIQCDGLTEMGLDSSQNYINNFSKISPLFLSINHESNIYTVRDLYKNNSDIKCISRNVSWYRDGYVEELLTKNN